ncbi:hypothetical protein ACMGDK_11695 [Chryseobacterium sp. DT-3]|uniref:hypothetical protein n=1 Tax=Chryseobacterium sp. DT-3 TaxID=3396164 RepID=UPI003F19A2A4
MIAPQELRLGNLVYVPGLFGTSTLIESIEFIYANGEIGTKSTEAHVSYYKSIPLTEKWLLKFGFENEIPLHWFNKVIINNYKGGFIEKMYGTQIQYVHQLQNLYFALTGEELTLKEEK